MKPKENKSILLEQFGDTPQLRIIDFLIDNHFFDFPVTEIAGGSNVSYRSLQKFFKNMIDSEFVIKTRRIGKSDYFKLNVKNRFVHDLMRLDWLLTKQAAGVDDEPPKVTITPIIR